MTTKAQRDAINGVLAHVARFDDRDQLVEALAQAALVGDVGTRYVVIVKNAGWRDYVVFGPYASPDTARKAIASGALATREGGRCAIYAMTPQPRLPKKKVSTRK